MNLFIPLAFADSGDHAHEASGMIGLILKLDTFSISLWASLLIFVLALFAYLVNSERERIKNFFFWAITTVTLVVTIVFIAQTIIKNFLSETGGPVHWHADFEVYDCGEELDLEDPTGLLNRIGTPILHEHGDKRIHVEGTLLKKENASLGEFFSVVGGELTSDRLIYPTNDGKRELVDGSFCEGSSEPSSLQVFAWTVEKGVATQKKIDDPVSYIPSPHAYVPPGDCLVIELSPEKDQTDYVCEQYRVAELNEELIIESSP